MACGSFLMEEEFTGGIHGGGIRGLTVQPGPPRTWTQSNAESSEQGLRALSHQDESLPLVKGTQLFSLNAFPQPGWK